MEVLNFPQPMAPIGVLFDGSFAKYFAKAGTPEKGKIQSEITNYWKQHCQIKDLFIISII